MQDTILESIILARRVNDGIEAYQKTLENGCSLSLGLSPKNEQNQIDFSIEINGTKRQIAAMLALAIENDTTFKNAFFETFHDVFK